MKDVAKLAGVSQTTVSFVLNNTPDAGIPQETKDRVEAAIAALGYRPNVISQNLRTKQSGCLGFVTDKITITSGAGKIIEGAQDVAWTHGKILLLVNTKDHKEMTTAAIEMLLERQVEGIIYAILFHRLVDPPRTLYDVPTVLLDCFAEDGSLASIVPEEVAGACNAISFLISKGHRRIGSINNSASVPATLGRLQGYQQVLSDAGIAFDHDLVRYTADSKGGYNQTMSLLKVASPPTAIFCFNDRTAMGAYDALRKMGLSIPQDVAVIGFDNEEIIAAHLYPGLTTMELPRYRMGEWAVNKLKNMIDKTDEFPLEQYRISCPLIKRGSV